MKLVDQWRTIEAGLPAGWEDVRLTLATEQAGDLPRAAQVLGSINAGKVGSTLVFHVSSAAGPHGVQSAVRSFEHLDRDRTWCHLEAAAVQLAAEPTGSGADPATPPAPAPATTGIAESWDVSLAPLPSDWTDLLCELEIDSSAMLDRTALLCAPLNPARSGSRVVFTFRCSGRSGYGVSPAMARRCFERLDHEEITGTTRILRVLSDTDNVDTQGPVWLVGGKTL
jgi:hypothetical protein